MRTLRLVFICLIVLALAVVLSANITWVELRLLPDGIGLGLPTVDVPVAAIIVVAFAIGFVVGDVFEFFRERKHRVTLAEKRRQVGALREENARLAQRLKSHGDEIGTLPG